MEVCWTLQKAGELFKAQDKEQTAGRNQIQLKHVFQIRTLMLGGSEYLSLLQSFACSGSAAPCMAVGPSLGCRPQRAHAGPALAVGVAASPPPEALLEAGAALMPFPLSPRLPCLPLAWHRAALLGTLGGAEVGGVGPGQRVGRKMIQTCCK